MSHLITAPITQARDAYQLALANGFIGTLQQWLDSQNEAAAFAAAASDSADSATASASTATTKASEAATSASNAETSETNAAASAIAAAEVSRLTAGTTTTGAPGSSAAVTITGAAGAQVLNLTVPQGPIGAIGATGATGAAGPTGLTGARGPQGIPGERGEDGSDGSSLELTSGPVRSAAGESSIADGALTIAKTLGLQAALNREIYPQRRVAFLGDSISGWWSNNGLGEAADSLGGFGGFARYLLGASFDIVASSNGYNFQTGGYTLSQIQSTWLPEVLASDADVCVLHGGTNGFGETADAKFATWQAIIDALTAAGIRPIATTLLPLGSGSDAGYMAVRRDFNRQIRNYCAANKILLCDWHDVLCDPSTGVAIPGYYGPEDLVHPNYTGHAHLGRLLAKTLAQITAPLDTLPSIADSQWISANPYVTGDVSGLATSWARTLTGAGTSTQTKVARTDGYSGTIQQVAVAGGGATADGVQITAPAGLGFVDNDMVRGVMEIEFDAAGWAAYTYGLTMVVVGGTNNAHRAYAPDVGSTVSVAALTEIMPLSVAETGRSIILATNYRSVGVGATYVSASFFFRGTGTFRIKRGGVQIFR